MDIRLTKYENHFPRQKKNMYYHLEHIAVDYSHSGYKGNVWVNQNASKELADR
jgi:hypothetical protein